MQAVTMDTKIRMPTCLASWSIKQALGSFFTRVVKIKSWLSSRDCPLSTDPTTEHPTRLILAPPPTHWTDQDRTPDQTDPRPSPDPLERPRPNIGHEKRRDGEIRSIPFNSLHCSP